MPRRSTPPPTTLPNLDGLSASEIDAMIPRPGPALLDSFDREHILELAKAARKIGQIAWARWAEAEAAKRKT